MENRQLSTPQSDALIGVLKQRFEKNMHRHNGLDWDKIEAKLLINPEKLWSLNEMEQTGGEPDVVGYDDATDEYVFFDCAAESPKGRRSFCYDRQALESRKDYPPTNNVIDVANAMGIELLTEQQYRALQTFGKLDTKTSSWIKTPAAIRELGGAIFSDFRYGTVFIYHNGASSYYAARGFRGCLKV